MNFALASIQCLFGDCGTTMVWQELVRRKELGVRRIGAGEVELGNQIRGLSLGYPRFCSDLLAPAPMQHQFYATYTSHIAPLSPSESSDLEIRNLLWKELG